MHCNLLSQFRICNRNLIRFCLRQAAGQADTAPVVGASEVGRYEAVYLTEHPELERTSRTGHVVGLAILFYYSLNALWTLSLWTLLQGAFYSTLAAKGAHAWQRWSSVRDAHSSVQLAHHSMRLVLQTSSLQMTGVQPVQEGRVGCSCKHCLWSVEGARNPSLALACEWEAAKEALAYVRATTLSCMSG